MNLIFTALLLFLILFWSCESDIHSFAVVFDFYFYHVSLYSYIHNFAVVFNFHLVSESNILSFAVFQFHSGHVMGGGVKGGGGGGWSMVLLFMFML